MQCSCFHWVRTSATIVAISVSIFWSDIRGQSRRCKYDRTLCFSPEHTVRPKRHSITQPQLLVIRVTKTSASQDIDQSYVTHRSLVLGSYFLLRQNASLMRRFRNEIMNVLIDSGDGKSYYYPSWRRRIIRRRHETDVTIRVEDSRMSLHSGMLQGYSRRKLHTKSSR
jgi:hypothetical protein